MNRHDRGEKTRGCPRTAALLILGLVVGLAGCRPAEAPPQTAAPGPAAPQAGIGGPALPPEATRFAQQLREELLPRYGGLNAGETVTLDGQGIQELEEERSCWVFDAYRGGAATGFGSPECLGRYYQDRETGQVYCQEGPDWFLAVIPGTFVWPEALSAETVWSELQRHMGETGHGVSSTLPETLTLAAAYPDFEDGCAAVGVYDCPATPDGGTAAPCMVLLHSAGSEGHYYLGALEPEQANSRQAVEKLVEAWKWAPVTYLPFVSGGGNYYDAATGLYTSERCHFTWRLPEEVRNGVLFRDTDRGVGVYCRLAYERYVAEHGGVDDGGAADPLGCGRLLELRAGPEEPRAQAGETLTWLPVCRDPEDPSRGVPAANGWYYAAAAGRVWYPDSFYLETYETTLQALLDGLEITPY